MAKNSSLQKTRQVYEDPDVVSGFWQKTKDTSMVKQLENFISLVENKDKVLDLGCGPGRDAKYLAERGVKVVGIDYSNEMVKLARELHKDLKDASFRKMDMRKLGFKDNEFAGVWACASLLHIPKKEIPKVLKEIWRVLKNHGIFFVAVKRGEGEEMIASDKYGKPMERFFSFFEMQELTNFLKQASFKIVDKQIEKLGKTEWIQIMAKKNDGR